MLLFLLAVFFLLATPGPGVLSTAGVGAAYGRAAGHRYVAGLCLGTNLVALAVVSGVAATPYAGLAVACGCAATSCRARHRPAVGARHRSSIDRRPVVVGIARRQRGGQGV